MALIDHVVAVGRRKLNVPDTFEFYLFECINTDDMNDRSMKLKGGTPSLLKSGKRKGAKTWRNCTDEKTVFVYSPEIDAEELRYENDTGICHECMGKDRPCARCKGTRKSTAG